MSSATEHRLREALAARAHAVQADSDAWDRLLQDVVPNLQAARRPRLRGRPVLAFAVTIFMAAVLLVGTIVLRGDAGRDNVAFPGGGPVGAAPDELVAILSNGDIVRVDASTGGVRGVVMRSAGRPPATPRGDSLDITPDHRTVFFSTLGPGCGGGVYQVPVHGGTPTLVAAAASDPAVSPDGRLLAFVEGHDQINCSLVVMDLSSGERRAFSHPAPARPASGPGTPSTHPHVCSVLPPRPGARAFLGDISYFTGINSLSWSPDSRHIAILAFEASASPLRPPEYIGRVHVLDTAAPGGLENMRLVGPVGDAVSTALWTGVQWQDARSLVVIGRHRCGPEGAERYGQPTGTVSDEVELLLVDTASRNAKAVAAFDPGRDDAPYRIEAASSGHVLWVSPAGTVATLRQGKAVTLAASSAARKFLAVAW